MNKCQPLVGQQIATVGWTRSANNGWTNPQTIVRQIPGFASHSLRSVYHTSQNPILDGDNFGDNFHHRDNFGIYPL